MIHPQPVQRRRDPLLLRRRKLHPLGLLPIPERRVKKVKPFHQQTNPLLLRAKNIPAGGTQRRGQRITGSKGRMRQARPREGVTTLLLLKLAEA